MDTDFTHTSVTPTAADSARVPLVIDHFDQWGNAADAVAFATYTMTMGDAEAAA